MKIIQVCPGYLPTIGDSFGTDYPKELAELINNVMGKKVGEVKLWDWDQVVKGDD